MNERAWVVGVLLLAGCAEVPVAAVVAPPVSAPVDVAALAALVHEHRPASGVVPMEDGRVAVPLDWRTLPLTAVLWEGPPRSDPRLNDPQWIGDLLVALEAGRDVVARDARTGVERWRGELDSALGTRAYLLAGCERVVVLDSTRIAGLDPATGELAWEVPIGQAAGAYSSRPGEAAMNGCRMVVQVADEGDMVADGFHSSSLRVLDVRDGTVLARPRCPAPCLVVSAEDAGVIAGMGEGERVLFGWTGGEPEVLPARSIRVAGGVALVRSDDAMEGRARGSGELVWRLEGLGRRGATELARLADAVVVHDGDTLRRISIATGEDVWRIAIDEDLRAGIARGDGRDHDGHHLVVGTRVEPQFLLDVDLDAGVVRSLRISAVDPVRVSVGEGLAVVLSHGEMAVVDLALDAPPLRERLSLEADVERTLAELGSSPGRGHPIDVRPWDYPDGRRDALEWLERLAPLVGDVVTPRVAGAELDEAASLLAAIPDPARATAAAVGVLERTYGLAPSAGLARARSIASASVGPGLREEQADALLRETVAWLDALSARPEEARADDEDAWSAVLAGRDALLSASPSSAPLDAFAEAVRRHAPTAPSLPDCEPSERDAIRAAALRWGYELSSEPRANVRAPGGECVRVQTLGGPLAVLTSEEVPEPPWMLVGDPQPLTSLGEDVLLPWPDAPTRWLELTWYAGPLAAQGELLVLQLVDGRWRVVFHRMTWVS